jgi:hypothetical protein
LEGVDEAPSSFFTLFFDLTTTTNGHCYHGYFDRFKVQKAA